jgi:hypothetical protein
MRDDKTASWVIKGLKKSMGFCMFSNKPSNFAKVVFAFTISGNNDCQSMTLRGSFCGLYGLA